MQLTIVPAAPDHVFDPEAALSVESHVAHAKRLGLGEVFAAGIATVSGRSLANVVGSTAGTCVMLANGIDYLGSASATTLPLLARLL